MIKCKLSNLRNAKDATQKELAEATNIRLATISDMERNKMKSIPCENLEILCEYFDCDVGDLFEYVKTESETIQIKYYVQKVSAGLGYDLNDDDLWEMVSVPASNTTEKPNRFIVTIEGDSMLPDFNDGDNVLVEATDTIDENEIGIFTVDGKGYIKKLGRNKLISLNPKYDDIPLLNTVNKCCGRVIGITTILSE